jgi:cell division transport system permease protein
VNLFQACGYFLREAARNLGRGLGSSTLAAFSIATSLFLVGLALLLAHGLGRQVEEWRDRARVVVYARPEASAPALDRLESSLRGAGWVESVRRVDADAAAAEFGRLFPQLADLARAAPGGPGGSAGSGAPPLPTSFEVEVRDDPAVPAALAALGRDSAVLLVDDDRVWLGDLMAAATALRLLAAALLAVLLGAALVTIGSVVRLKAYLDGDEIAVLRLVGATEFYIRGPFYAEAMFLGLIGGSLALAALWGAVTALRSRWSDSPLLAALIHEFLPWPQAAALVALGAAAGLVGAVVSLRRERLGRLVDATSEA